jgi:hypothetical protein
MDALKNRLLTERISTEQRAPSCSRAAEPNPVIDRITVVPLESSQSDVKELREQLVQAPAMMLVQRLVPRSVLAQQLVPRLELVPMNSSESPLRVR